MRYAYCVVRSETFGRSTSDQSSAGASLGFDAPRITHHAKRVYVLNTTTGHGHEARTLSTLGPRNNR